MTKFLQISALLLAGVGASAAYSVRPRALNLTIPSAGGSLSSSCQSALLGLTGDAAARECLNIPGLVAVLTLSPNVSAIPPLNTWLQGLCRADPCSNDTISTISANLTSACQSDISNTNVSPSAFQSIIQAIPTFYPTVRKIACLKTSSNDTLCVASTLLNIEQFLGHPLTANSAMSAITEISSDASQLPANLTCTGCTQAAFDAFQEDQAMLAANPSVQGNITQKCGAEFMSASPPANVVEGTGSAAPSATLAASTSGQGNSALAILTSGATWGVISSSLFAVIAGSFLTVA